MTPPSMNSPATPKTPATPNTALRAGDHVTLAALRAFLREHGAAFLEDPNVTSVGIGFKQVDGVTTEELSVQFTVAEKLAGPALESAGTAPLPRTVTVGDRSFPTDVLERSYVPSDRLAAPQDAPSRQAPDGAVEPAARVVAEAASAERRARVDPVVPGVSIAHVSESAGTLGAIVHDTANGDVLVMSNWHVLHGPEGAIGDDVVQPGPYDDSRVDRNHLGRLVRSHLGPAGDCAVASIEERGADPHVLELGVAPTSARDPLLGERLVKSGRSTGVTRGLVARTDVTVRLDYGTGEGEVAIGGFEVGPDPDAPADNGQISEGGDSGSAWLCVDGAGASADAQTLPVMAGLHFAGETSGPDHALACSARSVLDTLAVTLSAQDAAAQASTSAQTPGYDPDFLPTPGGTPVPAPTLTPEAEADAPRVDGSTVLDYTHFSLTMSTERRLARWVAWNVDGGSLKKLPRKNMKFRTDPRLPEDAQWDDALYRDNPIDRGHLARRSDLLWGPTAEAQRANSESFFFTNIAPQMDEFNQAGMGGVWGRLEDALFADVEVADLRINVFAGPVFDEDDVDYRGARVPDEYWKAIAWVEDGVLRARAFLLTQDVTRLRRRESLNLDEFATYQVTLEELTARTDVVFAPELHDAEQVGALSSPTSTELAARRPITRVEQIVW